MTLGFPAPAPGLRAIVVVPARDEATHIEACLDALCRQQRVSAITYELIVVLDGCTDGTAAIVAELAERSPLPAIHVIEFAMPVGVGRARRSGMDIACERLHAVGSAHGLIATTDADSVVAPDWLISQLTLVTDGARAIGGLVELHPGDLDALEPSAVLEREHRASERLRVVRQAETGAPFAEHHQFSGASLALTAETYRRCGGLPVRAALEDEALERELSIRGVAIHRSRTVRVSTSARTTGRAPRGLAHDLARSSWRSRNSHTAAEFPIERLLAEKQASVALVLPTREVAATLGPIAAHAASLQREGLIDDVLVVDSHSTDGSVEVASHAGLRVVQEDELSTEFGPAQGKGDAMWRAARELDSEIVAFVDTDTEEFGPHFISGLIGPLICNPGVALVKGCFRRPFRAMGRLSAEGGGRVTELMARPLLNLHAPELAVFHQPLAGETALRRKLLEQIPFSAGYGVEIAMLIDAWRIVGLSGLAQVDLGVRQNRHQSLRELSAMSYAVLVAAQTRLLGSRFADASACGSMSLPAADGHASMETRRVVVEDRPPIATLRRSSVGVGARVTPL